LTALLSRFLRSLRCRLKPHSLEYVTVSEWSTSHRHHHILIRTTFDLGSDLFGQILDKALGGLRHTHYCRTVQSAAASARYVAKYLKDDRKAELVPEEFAGRVVNCSRRFLVRPLAELWREQVAEWYGPRQEATGKPLAYLPPPTGLACVAAF
jgi:hypothetical protein